METAFNRFFIVFNLLFGISAGSFAHAATYYVSPIGNNANPGTITQPFATLQKAHDIANPGDTIYMRGGTYTLTNYINISRSGSSGNLIKVWNYPGETPILDGVNISTSYWPDIQFYNNASWWHFKGIEIKNSPSHGIYLASSASNNIVEFCDVHNNVRVQGSGAGILIEAGSNNLIVNNDVHHNGISGVTGTGGDGIGIGSQASGNVIRGNRAWRNNDDGIDLWGANGVLVENNWSWENGFDDNLNKTTGNGVGIKLGGPVGGGGNHIMRYNLAWKNGEDGFNDNGAQIPSTVYNNTAWANNQPTRTNFAFWSAVANILRNNLAFNPNTVSFNAAVIQDHNSWNLAVTVNSSDFVTLDYTANTGARKADGSLPDSNFLQLVAATDLIDKGVNVGLAYTGSAPDLGAYEYTNSVASPQAPSGLNLVAQP